MAMGALGARFRGKPQPVIRRRYSAIWTKYHGSFISGPTLFEIWIILDGSRYAQMLPENDSITLGQARKRRVDGPTRAPNRTVSH
jgi:hypothetical protein